MDLNVPSGRTQTDFVVSPILRQCLYVIQTVSEFKNLTYRVTKTRNDVEMAVVYREGVLGIFGPPADPITLTLDPKGRCLLTILFKPVQRVCIVSPESGQIDITSLLTLLRLVAGKGYLFCPGLPESFLTGKVCGKHVVLHRVPFKRYQSAQCPVYYQTPVFQQSSNKPSLCALCPRCMHAAKWIHALPSVASNSAGTAVQLQNQLPITDQLKSDQRQAIENISNINFVITNRNDSPTEYSVIPNTVNKLLSLPNCHNKTDTSVSSESQILGNISRSQLVSGVDVNGNSQTIVAVKDSHKVTDQTTTDRDNERTCMDTNPQILRNLLRQLLQDGCKRKSVDSPDPVTKIEGVRAVNKETIKAQNYRLEKGKNQKRNVCHHCKKQYSTPIQLMNHIQRHKVLSVMWQKKFREQQLKKKPSLFSLTHRMLTGSKFQLSLDKKKPSHLSETTIRLFLKRLNDMIPSQNGSTCLKQHKYKVKEGKIAEDETVKKQNCTEGTPFVSLKKIETESVVTRSGIKRTSSGLSPMQTLLEAAAIAEVDHAELKSLIHPSHIFFTTGKYQESALVSTTTQLGLPNVSSEQLQFSVPEKKPRKSTRLASKREKNNKKRTRYDSSFTERIEAENTNVSHEQSMLTNLNLLSTVSLETAMRQAPINPQIQAAVSSSIPLTVLSPENKKLPPIFPYSTSTNISTPKDSFIAHPTSKSISISQQLINNTSGGNVVISKSQETYRPFVSTNLQINSNNLPPLPPLLFAGNVQGKDLLYPLLSQTQQGQSQAIPVSLPSILRSLVTVGNNQPILTGAEPEAVKNQSPAIKNHSPNSDCGAMDLSKPKLPQTKANISAKIEKGIDFSSLSGLPHNIAQLVASNDNPSEVLQCFLMMTQSAGVSVPEHKDIKPITTIISDKQADSELQARMFASACNYRIDKAANKSQQVHSVIASSSRITKSGKGMKLGDVAPVQADEIQCGYKWSGSGGSVKERTQMVRELVPPDVMASFLTKPQLSNSSLQQLSVSLNTSQPHQPSPHVVQSSIPGWSAQSKSQDLSASELALNLITIKSSETSFSKKGVPGRVEISAPSVVISSPSPIHEWSPTSPGSMNKKIVKTSLANSFGILSQLKMRLSSATAGGATTGNPQKLQLKNLSQSSPSSLSLSTTPISSVSTTPSPTSSIFSPSLAAMLRQPAAATHETSLNNILNISVDCVTSLASVVQRNSINDSSVLILPREVHIKTEPMDLYNTQQGTVIMALPIKAEKEDTDIEMVDDDSGADSSPANLIVDMGPEKTLSRDVGVVV